MNKGDRTKLTLAKTKTDSLRTTVPSSIVRQKQGVKKKMKMLAIKTQRNQASRTFLNL